MSFHFRYPNITGKTKEEQLRQIIAFLRQLTDQLNWALNAVEAGTQGGASDTNAQ